MMVPAWWQEHSQVQRNGGGEHLDMADLFRGRVEKTSGYLGGPRALQAWKNTEGRPRMSPLAPSIACCNWPAKSRSGFSTLATASRHRPGKRLAQQEVVLRRKR